MYKVVKANSVSLAETVYVIKETKPYVPQPAAIQKEDAMIQTQPEGVPAGCAAPPAVPSAPVLDYERLLEELDRRKEIMEDAKQQADSILRDAARRAQEEYAATLERARQEADALRRQAMEEGMTNGARSQVEAVRSCVQQVELAISKFEGGQAGFMVEYEQSLKRLALEIASKILHKKVEDDPREMAELVKHAVSTVSGEKWVTVEISSEMPTLLETLAHKLQSAERGSKLDIRPVNAPAGSCYVETPGGIVDASLYTQIENLRDYFMAEPAL